jgi:hypothetical protein
MNYSSSTPQGILKYSFTNRDGVKLYRAMVEIIHYDNSPRNPSLPVIEGSHIAYGLTEEEAINHLRSVGYTGEIVRR